STVTRIGSAAKASPTGPLCLKLGPEALSAAEICRTCFHCSSPPWASMVILTRSCMGRLLFRSQLEDALLFKSRGMDGLLKRRPVFPDELGDGLRLAADDLLHHVVGASRLP